MFEQNLDISLICHQQPEQTLKCSQLEKDTSLEEILDEFSKQESCPKRTDESKKARTVLINPIKRIPSLLLNTEPIISSSDNAKSIRQIQIVRRDTKGLTSPTIHSATTRPSIEMIHNIPEAGPKSANMASNLLSGSDMLERKSTYTYSGGSNTLGNDLRGNSPLLRRLSSPNNASEMVQSPSRIIGANPLVNMMPNAPNRVPARPKFNVSKPEKNLNGSPSMKRNRPDLAGSSFINSPQSQSTKSLIKPKSIQLKLGTLNQDQISGEYLARVLQRSGASLGSNPGSNTQSPRIDEIPESNEYRFGKRGSFSVFKKIVEAEVVKDV